MPRVEKAAAEADRALQKKAEQEKEASTLAGKPAGYHACRLDRRNGGLARPHSPSPTQQRPQMDLSCTLAAQSSITSRVRINQNCFPHRFVTLSAGQKESEEQRAARLEKEAEARRAAAGQRVEEAARVEQKVWPTRAGAACQLQVGFGQPSRCALLGSAGCSRPAGAQAQAGPLGSGCARQFRDGTHKAS